jgi:acyl-CoA reductase-like NAD-dependent aldehyde dehydrogenase
MTNWRNQALHLKPATTCFIDGELRESKSGETFVDESPIPGIGPFDIASASEADVDDAVRSARQAFDDGRWRNLDPRQRKDIMLRFADLVREHADELALLETIDVGKPISDSRNVDVMGAARTIQWYGETIDKTYDEIAPAPRRALALITREPLGVIGAIIPWNYPMIIASWKLAPALAMGNSVVLKPAEQSPLTAIRLAMLGLEAGLPPGVLNVVPGTGPVAGRALAMHPLIDKVAFTGSGPTGRRIMEYAAQSNMKQVSLELGGKSPQVVLIDAPDMDLVASTLAWGIFYNAGQTCNAGSRVIIHPSQSDALVSSVQSFLDDFKTGDPLDESTQMGPIVDTRQCARIHEYLDLAKRDGGDLAVRGEPHPDLPTFVPPTIVANLPNTSRVVQEEIFGPVLVMQEAETEAQAIQMANDTPYGLAASVWTTDLSRAHRVARALRAGTVWVNTFDASDVITPFGGFKESGSGRDKSLHALDAYSALKTTWIDLGEE